MVTIRKTQKKHASHELTFIDVRQAARDAQKAFEVFVVSGKLPAKK